ncbi:major facilitator superfamily protein permease, partial [Neocallimastix californiae]
ICISATAGGLMATSLTTALPPIMEDLNVDVNTAQWLTSGFALFLAIMTPFTSYLITRFRTRILYLLSLIFFIAGLAVCAVSKVFWVMMLGRIIQGCGVGLISSISQVIIINIYPPEKLGSAMGWYGFSFSVAPIVAPTLAGLLVDSIGWRMIFVLSIAIMMIALIHAYFVVDDVLKTIKRDFDTISLIISAFSFGGITLAIGNMGKYDFVSYQVLMILIIGLVSTVIFVIRQLHQSLPFLDVRIFRNLGFTVSTIAIFLLQLTLLGNAIIFPVYVQQIKGKSATYSGLSVLPGSLASALISPVSGKIFDKFASIWIASAINILRCIAIASFNMPVFTWGMGSIPNNRVSDATALSNSVRSVGGALGSALFVSILTKVATTIGKDKPHPEMFGFNIVYLVMSILAFIIFAIGIF